ncbi:MAG: glycosyltransferase family 4 protein, partial [Thermoguttaceae bacterium]|nr:glycosyltransferase family 4 protein [Thermoguttaceae bacterium]
MRIIYLHQYFRTPAMSGGTRSYEMARRLVARGHEVHMITAGETGPRRGWTDTEEAGIRVHWCRVPYSNHMGFRARMIAFARFSWLAARKAASLDGDVIFATSTPLSIALPAIWAARRSRARMVFEVRDLWPEMPIAVGALKNPFTIAAARWLERMAYHNATHVVALSPGMKAGIVSTGYPEDKVSVIPNSCDVELFDVDPEVGRRFRREHAWLGDRPLVVYAGSLGFLNGVDYLARLAAVVGQRDSEIRFLVVGSGRQEESIRRAAQSLGVLDRTFFMLPSVPKAAMPAVYSAADIATSLFLDIPQ